MPTSVRLKRYREVMTPSSNAKSFAAFTLRHPRDKAGRDGRVQETPMKYFLYCRKSTESEDRQVLSIDSQLDELRGKFASTSAIQIVEIFTESFSAKAPGRPIFGEMLRRIEAGEANGIIAWHPDRLARNSIDGGRIIYLLDKKVLRDIKFATFTFENNSQGKFMLSIIFGYSKYYVDSLSENVKRGNRAKIARGWRPNLAPIGYLNDKNTRTIVPDPDRFTLVRRIFDLALTEILSLRRIALETHQWGLRSLQCKRRGGKYLNTSSVYQILRSPFYAGILAWSGELHQGAHESMITWSEFERVAQWLRRGNKPSPSKHFFPFTGLIRCGECGLSVTAENRVNRYGYKYTYYRCTKKRMDHRCGQRYISASHLENAFVTFLGMHTISEGLHKWAIKHVRNTEKDDGAFPLEQRRTNLKLALAESGRALSKLTALHLRDMISEDEFMDERKKLQEQRIRTEDELRNLAAPTSWLEPGEALVWFCSTAVSCFLTGDAATKRRLIQSVGSNLVLTDRILNIEARKPLVLVKKNATRSELWAGLNESRNLFTMKDPETLATLGAIQDLKAQYEKSRGVKKKAA